MYKKVFVFLTLIISLNSYALDELSSIPETHQKTIDSILKTFKLTGASKKVETAIYNKFKWALEQNDWQSYWIGNSDLSASKFKDDSVQIYDLIIVTKRSINNISFTYFPKANQIFYTSKQFLEGKSSGVLDAFKEMKAKETTKIIKEADNYGFTQKKGFMEFAIYHIKSPNALVSYIDYGLIDTK